VRQIIDEQLPVALEAQPDLVSLVGGGNDLLRPGADPDALAAGIEDAVAKLRAAGADVLTPPARTPGRRRCCAGSAGGSQSSTPTCPPSPLGTAPTCSTSAARAGCRTGGCGTDRIHLTAEGHRRMGLASAAVLRVPVRDAGDWSTPLPPRPLRTAVSEEPPGCGGSSRRGSAGG
jgi:lysophospholipase L1-like esterase